MAAYCGKLYFTTILLNTVNIISSSVFLVLFFFFSFFLILGPLANAKDSSDSKNVNTVQVMVFFLIHYFTGEREACVESLAKSYLANHSLFLKCHDDYLFVYNCNLVSSGHFLFHSQSNPSILNLFYLYMFWLTFFNVALISFPNSVNGLYRHHSFMEMGRRVSQITLPNLVAYSLNIYLVILLLSFFTIFGNKVLGHARTLDLLVSLPCQYPGSCDTTCCNQCSVAIVSGERTFQKLLNFFFFKRAQYGYQMKDLTIRNILELKLYYYLFPI